MSMSDANQIHTPSSLHAVDKFCAEVKTLDDLPGHSLVSPREKSLSE